jgi:hypothetical protein
MTNSNQKSLFMMVLFVILVTSNYILSYFCLAQQVTNSQGETVYYLHTVFMTSACIALEFLIIVCIVWPYVSLKRESWLALRTSFIEFLPPAFMNWSDLICYSIGVS